MNFIPASIDSGIARAKDFAVHVPASIGGPTVTVGVRSEDVVVAESDGQLRFVVDVVERLGFYCHAYGKVGDVSFVARLNGEVARTAMRGTVIALNVRDGKAHFFDVQSGDAVQ